MTAGFNIRMPDLAGPVREPSAEERLKAWADGYYTSPTEAARDYGPEPIDAKTAMGAANLLDAVRAANAPRLTVRLALVSGLLSHLDLLTPEDTTEC